MPIPTGAVPARRKARRRAVDVLYEAELRDEDVQEVLRRRIAHADPPVPEYTVRLVEGFATNGERIDELIASYSEGWTLDRMPVVDRNILRLATLELLYHSDIDAPVAITEAVELAKSLSTEDSPRFINGLLGRLADQLPTR